MFKNFLLLYLDKVEWINDVVGSVSCCIRVCKYLNFCIIVYSLASAILELIIQSVVMVIYREHAVCWPMIRLPRSVSAPRVNAYHSVPCLVNGIMCMPVDKDLGIVLFCLFNKYITGPVELSNVLTMAMCQENAIAINHENIFIRESAAIIAVS